MRNCRSEAMPEGRIIKALSGFYYVQDGEKQITCRGRGRFRKDKTTPYVGDYVIYKAESTEEGYILEVYPRKNQLVRPPIVNIDQAFLVFSVREPDFQPFLLNRFLTLIEHHQIEPVIILTKTDLLDAQEYAGLESQIKPYRALGYQVFLVNHEEAQAVSAIRSLICDKITTVAGQTGVGKSSLLNVLAPHLDLKTGEISKSLGRGKHTTRHVELIPLYGGWIADTPGFSSLDLDELELEDLRECFPEFVTRQNDCKYRGCNHLNEPDCKVKEDVKAGLILSSRYQDYVTFAEEIKDRKRRYEK